MPESFADFADWLVESNEKESGYICKKNGFEFLGGRIAQRAYYDSLRDVAHLSPKNSGLTFPLRFAKKKFEDLAKTRFLKIPIAEIKIIIRCILHDEYSVSLSKI